MIESDVDPFFKEAFKLASRWTSRDYRYKLTDDILLLIKRIKNGKDQS